MKRILLLLLCLVPCLRAQALAPEWRKAREGWQYEWPRDHATHPGFKTEWWYFTGNLLGADGRRFGYQLTFFRQGVRHPDEAPAKSRFVLQDLKFGHFTLTDLGAKKFRYTQRISRGAFGEAGFGDGVKEPRLAWLERWTLQLEPDGSFRIAAREEDRSLELHLVPAKPWAVQGENGLSRKAVGDDHASHYYSGTRLRSTGKVTVEGRSFDVQGESWFDHEWATNQLAAGQVGWDWFSLQLDDGNELMLYRLRREDGSIDIASSGSWVAADGTVRHLRLDEMEVVTTRRWKSPKSQGDYPMGWKIRIPSLDLQISVTTPLEEQELVLNPVTYWEGMVDVTGSRAGKSIRGHGYVELTGYAGKVVGLTAPE